MPNRKEFPPRKPDDISDAQYQSEVEDLERELSDYEDEYPHDD